METHLQQEEQAVEGKHEELTLLVHKQECLRVLLRLWEDTGQTSAAHRDAHSYLISGVAEQQLPGLHEVNRGDGACVAEEPTHRL
ncbi:hypothetical protein EYF80_017225 [Liparis tanakae]|uniref:Uncharacterized protein n=1 Tax=Liparis tanakae TaxID=230148 RepID=A0A4Z2I3U8_9TELE|nr:hypothetical protein EYF80_017225 [Liparis tanakae]